MNRFYLSKILTFFIELISIHKWVFISLDHVKGPFRRVISKAEGKNLPNDKKSGLRIKKR